MGGKTFFLIILRICGISYTVTNERFSSVEFKGTIPAQKC